PSLSPTQSGLVFFQAEDGIRYRTVTGVQTCALPIWRELPAIVREVDAEAKARVIVISSTGKHFSAGMDLSVFTEGRSVGTSAARSEERRVGKEWRGWVWRDEVEEVVVECKTRGKLNE